MSTEDTFYTDLYTSLVKAQIARGQTPEDAQDLAQQAIVQMLADQKKYPKKYRSQEEIKKVAHTAARNLLATMANRDGMMKRRHVPIKDEETFTSAHHPSAETEVLKRQGTRRLSLALEQTSDEMKDTLQRIADGESLTNIAQSKKINRGTAGKQVMTARERIKRFLKGN